MSESTTVWVKANNPHGPGGRFCRAGFRFGPEFQEVELTDKQLKAVEAEPKLILHTICPPGFEPQGEGTVSGPAAKTEEHKKKPPVDKVFTKQMTAAVAIAKINEAKTLEELKAISIKGDDKVTVKDAYAAANKKLKGKG